MTAHIIFMVASIRDKKAENNGNEFAIALLILFNLFVAYYYLLAKLYLLQGL